MALKKEPQNLEAEINALGCAFVNDSSLEKVCEELISEMFYSKANAKIFSVVKELHTKNIPVDSTTVIKKKKKSKELSEVGGIEYITEIIDKAGSVYHVDCYFAL